MKEPLLTLISEMSAGQKEKILRYAAQKMPQISWDDLKQPNDFPLLEEDPYFRYEEGVLEGILSVQSALYAYFHDQTP